VPTSFPTGLDAFPNPTASDLVENATADLDHHAQHANANDAVEALEAKVGINSSAVTTSLDYLVANHTHSVNYQTVRDEGSSVTARPSLNFVGSGVAVTDDSGNGYTQVTINNADVRTIVTTAATTRNNNTALTDITGLTTTIGASEHWEGTAVLFYDSSTVADIKFSLIVPTGAMVRGIAQGLGGGVTSEVGSHRLHAVDASGMTGLIFGGLGAGNRCVTIFNFRVLNSTTAGAITFQMAQSTAEVSDTICQAESWMTVAKVA